MPSNPNEITRRIHFPVYGYTVYIVITDDVDASRLRRSRVLKGDYKALPYTKALTSEGKDGHSCYLFSLPGNYAHVVHESSHVVFKMLRYIGADTEEEIFAYTQTYIFDQGVKALVEWDKRFTGEE